MIRLILVKLLAFCIIGRCQAVEVKKADVETRPASPLGNKALTANGKIQPHGLPTKYWFQYGPTTEYGRQTTPVSLPPKLAAFYHESWDAGPAGWQGGMSGNDLMHHAAGGISGGFMRYSEPSGDDPNHTDGIGTLHLASYFYPATHPTGATYLGWWAAGDPDLRDAQVTLSVRGNQFTPCGAEFVWWTQSDNDLTRQLTPNWRRANWAYTGFTLTDALLTGKWELVTYRLTNDSHAWTYGGNNIAQNRPNYEYESINRSLGHLNCNFFHLLAFVNPQQRPTGTIDLDELTVAYRNYSLVSPGNGGKLRSAPPGGTNDASKLTDGWRHGMDRSWASGTNPSAPMEFTYEFAAPVTMKALQLHQHAEWPAKDVEVLTAEGGTMFSTLATATMPEKSPAGPNFTFLLVRDLNRRASAVKIRILSGYRTERWGLGEIELFGEGGVHSTDDDWYHVNLDLNDLQPGTTYHYRLVAENTAGNVVGPDMAFTVPADARPHAVTGNAIRIRGDSATVTGRLTPMGKKTNFYFEYGLDTNYGSKSAVQYGGLQITPRHAACGISGLKPNTLYHYRLVGVNEVGTTFGADATFHSQ